MAQNFLDEPSMKRNSRRSAFTGSPCSCADRPVQRRSTVPAAPFAMRHDIARKKMTKREFLYCLLQVPSRALRRSIGGESIPIYFLQLMESAAMLAVALNDRYGASFRRQGDRLIGPLNAPAHPNDIHDIVV